VCDSSTNNDPHTNAHVGTSFGELALMYNAPRAATVKVCVCVFMYGCVSVYDGCVYGNVYDVCVCVCVDCAYYICIYMKSICVYVYVCVCVRLYVYVCVCVRLYVYVHVLYGICTYCF